MGGFGWSRVGEGMVKEGQRVGGDRDRMWLMVVFLALRLVVAVSYLIKKDLSHLAETTG